MRKNMLVIIASIIAIGALSSCGSSNNANISNTKTTEDTSINVDKKETSSSTSMADVNSFNYDADSEANEEKLEFTWTRHGNYSEGLAWTAYSDGGTNYVGAIDKKGKLKFTIPINDNWYSDDGYDDKIFPTEFEDGYSYIDGHKTVDLIDKSGKLIASYPDESVVAYGDGYFFMRSHDEGNFNNAASYKYELIDSSGKSLMSYNSDISIDSSMAYYGKGVFFCGAGKTYFTKSQKTVEDLGSFWHFCDNHVVYLIADGNIAFLNDRGEIDHNVDTPLNNEESIIPYNYVTDSGLFINFATIFKNGRCALVSHEKTPEDEEQPLQVKPLHFYVYTYNGDKFTKLPDEYFQKLNWPKAASYLFHYSKSNYGTAQDEYISFSKNGNIALPLLGADGKEYAACFNSDLAISGEPIRADDFTFIDDRLVIENDQNVSVYDGQGKHLFDFEKGDSSDNNNGKRYCYADNAINNISAYAPEYYDLQGELLFKKTDIDIKHAKVVHLPNHSSDSETLSATESQF